MPTLQAAMVRYLSKIGDAGADTVDTVGSKVRLASFKSSADRGASRSTEALWYVAKRLVFLTAIRWPSSIKVAVLRRFGANVGSGVVIAPRVNIHMPWKLTIGDHSWVGEEVFILNLELVTIGANACVSQRAFLCAGNHDYKSTSFDYSGLSIVIGDGAWLGAQTFVGPGLSIGVDTVVGAGSVVLSDLPDRHVCAGNPCRPVRPRVFYDDEAAEAD